MSLAENYNPVTQTDQLLLKKKGIYANEKNVNALRNVIKNEQEQIQYKQSKPFSKKYGSQNTTAKFSHQHPPQSRQSQSNQPKSEKEIGAAKTETEHKNNTKQSFNKKLNNNIIKDEVQQSPQSKQSYRIKKISDNKLLSPKQTRDSLMSLNEQEKIVQRQILEIHKSTKAELERMKQQYKIQNKRLSDYLPQTKNEEGNVINWDLGDYNEKPVQKLGQIIKQKQKQLAKCEHKIATNAYLEFLQKIPTNIEELNESQQEDTVEQLPQDKPRLQNNRGSYSTTMTSMKNKNYGLNLRRTYDIFKGQQEKNEVQGSPTKQEAKQQIVKEQGENRMTLNQKFKDFLLN